MNLEILPVGDFQTNCYIFTNNLEQTFIIDPGGEGERIAKMLTENKLKPEAILMTHGHLDHIKGTHYLAEKFGIDVFIHEKDLEMFSSDANELPPFLFRDCQFPTPRNLNELAPIDGLEIVETPGHTPGGVCFWFKNEKKLFSGDTLFEMGIGRTDLPGGDTQTLLNSLQKLTKLVPEEVAVYPGHGGSTTIEQEINFNPYLR